MRAELAQLEAVLGYRFASPDLLRRALTHSSAAHEAQPGDSAANQDNERLEFLGDSILGFVTSEALVTRHPDAPEGELSRLRAHLVSATHLYGVASGLDLAHIQHAAHWRENRDLIIDIFELAG